MTRERMLEVRDHILNKRYAQARAVLSTLDHPKAQEWLEKLEALELGDPFQDAELSSSSVAAAPAPQTRNANQSSQLLQDATTILLQNGWQLRYQGQNNVHFEKKRAVNALLAALVVVLFSLLGTAIVCLAIATARTERITLEMDGWGKLLMTTSGGTYILSDIGGVTSYAQPTRSGATYAGAIAGGVIILIILLVCRFSTMPVYYYRW